MKLFKNIKHKKDLIIFWSYAILQIGVLASIYFMVLLVMLFLLGLFMGVIAA